MFTGLADRPVIAVITGSFCRETIAGIQDVAATTPQVLNLHQITRAIEDILFSFATSPCNTF